MRAVIYSLAGVLIVAGLVVAIASFLSPGQVIHGIDAGLAGVLLAGGAVTLGLAGLTEAVEGFNHTLSRTLRLLDTRAALTAETAAAAESVEAAAPFAAPQAEAEQPALGETTVAAEPASLREDTPAAESPPETTLEAARDTVEEAPEQTVETVAVVEEVEIAETPAAAPEAAAAEAPTEELYVVEERELRGKPARVLSDGTVEAETDEGWMRFENMEHLEEYMDAMDAQRT